MCGDQWVLFFYIYVSSGDQTQGSHQVPYRLAISNVHRHTDTQKGQSLSSPSIMWVPGIEIRSIRSGGKYLYLLNHLAGPVFVAVVCFLINFVFRENVS